MSKYHTITILARFATICEQNNIDCSIDDVVDITEHFDDHYGDVYTFWLKSGIPVQVPAEL